MKCWIFFSQSPIRRPQVEVKLQKVDGTRWDQLERKDTGEYYFTLLDSRELFTFFSWGLLKRLVWESLDSGCYFGPPFTRDIHTWNETAQYVRIHCSPIYRRSYLGPNYPKKQICGS